MKLGLETKNQANLVHPPTLTHSVGGHVTPNTEPSYTPLPLLERFAELPARPMPPARGLLSAASVGRHYELATLDFLRGPPFFLYALIHSGRKADKGVDLRGLWDLAFSAACAGAAARGERLPRRPVVAGPVPSPDEARRRKRWGVVVQCKRWAERVGPDVVRELEGSLVAHGPGALNRREAAGPSQLAPNRQLKPVLGILVSLSGFTPGALLQAAQSELPIMLLHLLKVEPPIRRAEGASEGDGRGEPEQYEARRIEMNGVLKDVLEDGAYEVIERIGTGKERSVKLEWNWLEPA